MRKLWQTVKEFLNGMFKILGAIGSYSKWLIPVVLMVAVIQGLLPIASVWIPKLMIDVLISDMNISTLLFLAAALVGVQLLNGVLNHFEGTYLLSQYKRVEIGMTETLAKRFSEYRMESIEENKHNVLKEKAFGILENHESVKNFAGAFARFVRSVVIMLWAAYFLVNVNILLLAVLIGATVFVHWISGRKKQYDYSCWSQWAPTVTKTRTLVRTAVEKKFAKDVRIFNAQDFVLNSVVECDDEMTGKLMDKNDYHTKMDARIAGVTLLQDLVLYGYFAWLLLTSRIGISDFSVYFGSISKFISSVKNAGESWLDMKLFCDYLLDYFSYLELELETKKDAAVAKDLDTVHTIEFDHVSFRYAGQEKFALRDVSVTVHEGEHISVVGANGAGKSTFIKLLIGLYEPSEGEIRINGVPLRQYSNEEKQKLFSALFQDFKLFPVTILENTSLTEDGDADLAFRMYEKVGLAGKISSLPAREKSVLSMLYEEGVDLSGGERLKLALARIMYHAAPALVLDEPSAALDPLAEFEFYDLLKSMTEDKLTLYVSHRLISCTMSDRVLVFDDGQIIEDGPHGTLVRAEGKYRQMYEAQAQMYMA